MAAIAPATTSELLDLLWKSNLLPTAQLKAVPGPDALPPDPRKAAAVLVQRGLITAFQSTQLLAGRHKGFRIGPYAIQDLLGRGGMGAVYLAQHLELNRKVAIKILAPLGNEGKRLAAERFLREGRAAAALDHPNIVRIFDVARHHSTPYLVMEYVDGETLQQTLDRDGTVPFEVAAEYIAQTASGLQHAHERGLIHRDIKPGNLIRDRFGVVKVLDMGLARTNNDCDKLTEQLDEGAVVGTADYISPEQAINCPSIDSRADLYSLGATLFALIVGKAPFEGNTTQKLMQHQLKDAPSLRELDRNVPEELAAVVAKMLAKRAADRYQTAAEVVTALAPWASSSAHVFAGVSRTRLGANATRAEVQERVEGSSRRLRSSTGASESAISPETGVISSDNTIRDPNRSPAPAPAPVEPKRRRWAVMVAAVGVVGLCVVGSGAWLVSRNNSAVEHTVEVKPAAPAPSPTPGPVPQPVPKSNPPVTNAPPVNPPAPTPPTERSRLAADFSALKPFVVRSGLTVDPVDANRHTYLLISQTGAGAPPAGWTARCWNKDTDMELFADATNGPSALGIRNARGPGSAMLFSPRFECPSGVVRLKLVYAADLGDKTFTIRFRSDDQRPAWDVARPAVGGGAWRTEELLVDLKGASGGFFEFHNNDPAPGAALRFRAVSVVEPDPASADRVVFKFEAADLPGFKNAKTGRAKTSGEDEPKIRGVSFVGWKPETQSEWVCGPVAGAKAVGITNLNDVISAQIGFDLESGLGLKFAPGQLLRLRVAYRTSGKGRGAVYFQNTDDYKVLARTELPNTNTEWQTVEVLTTRGANPLRCLVDTSEKGTGNTLFVRSVTVAEVGAPRPLSLAPTPRDPQAPQMVSALDPANWTEGARVYALDVSAIPAFRTQKEKGQRLGGDAEQLPAGVGCQCWKAGAVGDFRCEKFDGSPALGLANLNDERSSEYYFYLEGAMKIAFQPDKAYRVKVGYRTANEAAGTVAMQITPGYKALASAKLPTENQWKTATVSFVRPPRADNVELRLVINNTSVGEGNTLWVRSIEIVELVPPKK